MEPLLTPEQVGEVLGISAKAVTNLLRRGELRGVKVSHKWRITEEALNDYLRKDAT